MLFHACRILTPEFKASAGLRAVARSKLTVRGQPASVPLNRKTPRSDQRGREEL
jgi:hypothetical protein